MNANEFAKSIHDHVYRSALEDTRKVLEMPPGRHPRTDAVELSSWYNTLSADNKARVLQAARVAADTAIFGFMAVLDGVRTVDDNHTELSLTTDDGNSLNEQHDLHELFQIEVDYGLGYVDKNGRPIN